MGCLLSKTSSTSLNNWNKKILTLQNFENQKEKVERLEEENQNLLKKFIELKQSYDDYLDNLRLNKVEEKLHLVFNECNTSFDEIQEIKPSSENEYGLLENDSNFKIAELEGKVKYLSVENYEKELRIHDLEGEIENSKKIYDEVQSKNFEIERLKSEIDFVKKDSECEQITIREDFTKTGLLLCERYEEEKKEINAMWETRVFDLMSKLNNSKNEMEDLMQRNGMLQKLFDEINSQSNYESRREDLDRIADLETQLIIQAEELEKQKEIIKILEVSMTSNLGVSDVGTSPLQPMSARRRRRNKKNRSIEIVPNKKTFSLSDLQNFK